MMRRMFAGAAAGFFSIVAHTDASASGQVFRCVMKETRHISADGLQATYPKDIYAGDVIIADTTTGLVRMFGTQRYFNITQRAGSGNGWILTRVEEGSGSTSVTLFAIKTYEKTVPFMFTGGMLVHSGRCEVIG
ncbi:hypothetical protein ABIE41_001473 [Bosea sp. OAE506]|uniref:hypothetical protein n=1 Tax=Bosea sp. OAE506 TaxID=2663870 RepID=UPI00178A2E95